MQCEQCNGEIPNGRNDTPAYKSIFVLRPGLPPRSLRVCAACWRAAVTPGPAPVSRETAPAPRPQATAPVVDLPLFQAVTHG